VLRRARVVAQLVLAFALLVGLSVPDAAGPERVIAFGYDVSSIPAPPPPSDRTGAPREQALRDPVARGEDRARGYDDTAKLAHTNARPIEYRSAPRSVTGVADDAGRAAWPPNRGFDPISSEVTLPAGARVDRFGYPSGTFASPTGTPFGARGLPPAYQTTRPYYAYEVAEPLTVRMGPARPWFGQPGWGVQYEFPESFADLLSRGVLKDVTP
jgi:hypothetical protein